MSGASQLPRHLKDVYRGALCVEHEPTAQRLPNGADHEVRVRGDNGKQVQRPLRDRCVLIIKAHFENAEGLASV
jgi:hypothetical protein